ncbi:ferric-chelate reductase [Rhizodiscina lignyota]|uniref:Ferric-chelate reductase n=1 Tax=Rhizodiscina lignyota TaxID=1504668 RepID=A0A9P4M2D7_9PEZI|nr:ferric-chelate reductase [Rhizodiscina lignyota]
MKLLTILLVLSGVAFGTVDEYTGCLQGAQTAVNYLIFNVTDPTDYYGNLCTNKLYTISMYAAAKLYCTPREIQAGFDYFNPLCQEDGGVELVPYSKIEPLLTDGYIISLPVANYSDYINATVFNTPVLISRSYWEMARDTYVRTLYFMYLWAMYGFWGGILLIGMINRFITSVRQSRRLKAGHDIEGRNSSVNSHQSRAKPIVIINSFYHWFRSTLIIPAAFGSHHNRPVLWMTIPTRMETIVIATFYVMNFILCCVGYKVISLNLYYSIGQQGWRYIADRTGIISYACLPWLWLFAGRNNIFLWLTGWSFATFNMFHRHIARWATICAIVHSINWSVLEGEFGYFGESWTENYWYMGGMATIAMSLLALFSFMWFRVKSYEVFLIIHISLSVITLVGLFYHTAIFDGSYNPYLWPPVAIWCFDRVARVVRFAFCNLHVKSRSVISTKASATYSKDGDFVRLELVPGSTLLKPGPGQHYFLYQPMKWKGWENHPFTLGAYERIRESDEHVTTTPHPNSGPQAESPAEKEIQNHSAGPSSSHSSDIDRPVSQDTRNVFHDVVGKEKLTFIIRPFGSWTRRLREECLKSPTGVITPHIFLEGPYGECSPLHTFENVVFIVGGTGVSGALPYMQEHIKRVASNTSQAADSADSKRLTITKDITFVWSAKQASLIRDIAAHELKPFLGRDDIHVHLHSTSHADARLASVDIAKGGEELKIIPSIDVGNDINVIYGRPDIEGTILNAIDEVNGAGAVGGGKIAILTCGPAGMADEARAAVHKALKQGKRGVEYIEETFG